MYQRRETSNLTGLQKEFQSYIQILGYFELSKHKPWLDEGCSKLSNQSKQAKLQWLQVLSKINGGNLNNVRR
jgi:hypothetical protein